MRDLLLMTYGSEICGASPLNMNDNWPALNKGYSVKYMTQYKNAQKYLKNSIQ